MYEFSFGLVVGTVAGSFLMKTGGLLAKDTYQHIKAITIGRDDQSDNDEVLSKIVELEEEKQVVEREKEKAERRLSEFDRITRSLRDENVDRVRLIEHYWDPLNVVIISFTNQKDKNGNEFKFLKRELQARYSLKWLSGNIYLIPPASVPDELQKKECTREDIHDWLEEEVYSTYPEARSTVSLATVADLRNIYSRTDHPDEDRINFTNTIDEVLNLEEIFDREDFSKVLASERVNLSKLIEEGDIAFFASKYLTTSELEEIHENQDEIAEELGNPNLKGLSSLEEERLIDALQDYVSNPTKVAQGILQDAQVWERELYGKTR